MIVTGASTSLRMRRSDPDLSRSAREQDGPQRVVAQKVEVAHKCQYCPYDTSKQDYAASSVEKAMLRIHLLLDEPYSSVFARIWSMLIMFLILVSTVSFCLETLPSLADSDAWFIIETVVVIIFTAEFILRFASSSNRTSWLVAPLNVIDLFAVVPYYVDILSGSSDIEALRVFRVVRLARVFRLFKISRYSSYMQIMADALQKSGDAFGLLLFFITLAVIIFSSLIFFAERGTEDPHGTYRRTDGEPSPFNSIPASFYWAIVTMTTVGYGDIVPITPVGKVIASVTMVCGILVIALPVTILGSNFQDVYMFKKQRQVTIPVLTDADRSLAEELAVFRKHKRDLDRSLRRLGGLVVQSSLGTEVAPVWSAAEYVAIGSLNRIEEFLSSLDKQSQVPEPLPPRGRSMSEGTGALGITPEQATALQVDSDQAINT